MSLYTSKGAGALDRDPAAGHLPLYLYIMTYLDYIINDILDRLDELENELVDDDIDCETDDLPDDDDE